MARNANAMRTATVMSTVALMLYRALELERRHAAEHEERTGEQLGVLRYRRQMAMMHMNKILIVEAVATTTEVVSIGPGVRQGLNKDNEIGYTGPCPFPIGLAGSAKMVGSGTAGYNVAYGPLMRGPDSFYFKIYALDTEIDLGPDATKDDLLRAIDGHILAGGELTGEYVQKRKF